MDAIFVLIFSNKHLRKVEENKIIFRILLENFTGQNVLILLILASIFL